MIFSIIITTRNRSDDLSRTLTRLQHLEPSANEIIVCADGCSDGTIDMVRSNFPDVKLHVNAIGIGSVASRDAMLQTAAGDWVLVLDDDSYPMDDDFFLRVLPIIAQHSEAAVITFIELRDEDVQPRENPSENLGFYVSSYPNCAALMRRDLYFKSAGFAAHFIHMYEEPDYALQCYGAGYAVWFEPSLAVRHHLSAVSRQPVKRHHQNARNELWSVWMRCPWPWLPVVSAFRVWRQFRYACTEGLGWVVKEPVWWLSAFVGIATCLRQRSPLPWPRYVSWMRLARNPVFTLQELHDKFKL